VAAVSLTVHAWRADNGDYPMMRQGGGKAFIEGLWVMGNGKDKEPQCSIGLSRGGDVAIYS
jgi:hypothetical protein